MNLEQALNLAKKMTTDRLSENPDYELYLEIDRQLALIKSNMNKTLSDEDKENISIGLIAVREFEETDNKYADILGKVSYLYKNPEIKALEE